MCRVAAAEQWEIEEKGAVTEAKSSDLVVRAVIGAIGDRPVRITIDNEIPRSRGLGSSSAVSAAAAAAAIRATGREPVDGELFDLVTELEGHPDNAAAAVFGGLVAAHGSVIRQLPMHETVRVVVAIPGSRLSTHMARAALPQAVRHSVAARSVARAVFLLEGLRTGDPASFAAAGGDELHEAPRAELSPITGALMNAARDAGALHAAWSGAGPTAIAFTNAGGIDDVMQALKDALGGDGEVRELSVATTGWS